MEFYLSKKYGILQPMKIFKTFKFYISIFIAFFAVIFYIFLKEYSATKYTLSFLESISLIYKNIINGFQYITLDTVYYSLSEILFVIFHFTVSFLLIYFLLSLLSYIKLLKNKKRIQKAFLQYVNPSIVQDIINNPEKLKLGGKSIYLTVYFIDIENFSQFVGNYHPKKVVEHLNEFFSEMSKIILENNGTVDKYAGDGIMAFWGAPKAQDDHAINACKAGIEHQKKLTELRKKWKKENKPEINAKIGIVSGEVIVGNIGSKGYFNYTVIGEPVNMCFEIEKLNEVYGSKIIVSESTYHQAKHDFEFRELGDVIFKSSKKSSRIFELLERKNEIKNNQAELIEAYHEALEMFRGQDFEKAKKAINYCLRISPNDKATMDLDEKIKIKLSRKD